MGLTRFGILATNLSYGIPSDRLFSHVRRLAEAVESSPFDSLWLPDHVVQGPVGDVAVNHDEPKRTATGPAGPHQPIFDAPTFLCALAVITERLTIGPLVSPVTIRHPALLAKSITTSDVVSGGRVVLGLGAAWDGDEHRRYGLDFPAAAGRVDRLEDAVQICRAMLDEEAATFRGKLASIDEAYNVPRPVNGHVPILIGGSGPRTLRLAARHADACNPIGPGDHLRAAFATVADECERIGRDPAAVDRIAGVMFHRRADVWAQVGDALTAGAQGVILVPWQLALAPDEIGDLGEGLVARFG